MNASIYDKTEKGREEIATRKYQLASRLRTLLVMIDGKQTAADIMKKVAALGLTEQNLQELLEQEFIIEIAVQTETSSTVTDSSPASESIAATTNISTKFPEPAALEITDAERFQALYNFYNETIKSAIGLRGYGLQLKVERAANIDDFRALRQTYVEAVQKTKGPEMARSLSDRLDLLLGKA